MSQVWLVKQEPEEYSWSQMLKEGGTAWTGVRNYQARNFLRKMKRGDPVLVYHSVTEKQVVGLARVGREAYPDPTVKGEDWSAVDVEVWQTLRRPVSLDEIKKDAVLKKIPLIRQSRLSVMPLSKAEFRRILRLAETSI